MVARATAPSFFLFCASMVTKSRLEWILQQLAQGRQCRCRVNSYPGKLIVHVVLTDTYSSKMLNFVPFMIIQAMEQSVEQFISVDHGHRNSKAECHCSLVFKLPSQSVDESVDEQAVGVDAGGESRVDQLSGMPSGPDPQAHDAAVGATSGTPSGPKLVAVDRSCGKASSAEAGGRAPAQHRGHGSLRKTLRSDLARGARVQVMRGRSVCGSDLAGQFGRIRVASRHDSSLTMDDGTSAPCFNRDLLVIDSGQLSLREVVLWVWLSVC